MTTDIPDFAVPLLQALVFVSALIVLFLSEPAINRMSPCSSWLTRLAFHFLVVGGAGNALYVALGDKPNWPETVMIAGVALLLVRDRLRPRAAGDRRNRTALEHPYTNNVQS